MIMTDSSGKIVRWNHQSESTFKYKGDYAIGKDVGLIMVETETPR
jgi:PAS domain-containing protein